MKAELVSKIEECPDKCEYADVGSELVQFRAGDGEMCFAVLVDCSYRHVCKFVEATA